MKIAFDVGNAEQKNLVVGAVTGIGAVIRIGIGFLGCSRDDRTFFRCERLLQKFMI